MFLFRFFPSFLMTIGEHKAGEFLRLEGKNNFAELVALNIAVILLCISLAFWAVNGGVTQENTFVRLIAILLGVGISIECIKNIRAARGKNYLNERVVFSGEGIALTRHSGLNGTTFIKSNSIRHLILTESFSKIEFVINYNPKPLLEINRSQEIKDQIPKFPQEIARILGLSIDGAFSVSEDKEIHTMVLDENEKAEHSANKRENDHSNKPPDNKGERVKHYKPKHFKIRKKKNDIIFEASDYSSQFSISVDRKIFWLIRGLTGSVSYKFSEISQFKIKLYDTGKDNNMVSGRLSFLDPDGYRTEALRINVRIKTLESVALVELREDLLFLARKMNTYIAD